MKRVITLDVLRGIAIFMVIVSHAFIYVVDMSALNPSMASILTLILLSPFIFLGKWKGFFLVISAASQVYSMSKEFQSNSKPIVVLLKQLMNAVLLLVVAYFFKIFLLPNAVLYDFIFYGVWDPASRIGAIQFSDTLESIALSRIIIALFYYGLTRGKGLERPLLNIAIFGVLSVVVITLRPYIVEWVLDGTGLTPFTIRSAPVTDWRDRLYFVVLANLVGYQEPLFPFLSSALFGAMYGIVLSQQSLPRKKFMRIALTISLIFAFIGLGMLPFSEDIVVDIETHLHATWMLFLNLGVQSICFLTMMRLIELNPIDQKREQNVRRLRFFRRYGMLSLTIFCLELVELIPRWFFTQIFNIDLVTGTTTNMGILLLVVLGTLALWYGILRLWELIKFYGSLEVFMKLFTALISWKKPNFGDPLNSKSILYEAEVISLVTPTLAE